MKHLKTFKENYITGMSDMVDPEPGFTPPFEPGSEDEVIQRYVAKFPDFSEFFENFLDRFPDKETFEERLWDYFDEDEYDDADDDDADDDDEDDFDDLDREVDDRTEDDIRQEDFDRLWSPEAEVNMLQSEVNGDYPGDDIWPDFWNDLCETDWNNKK